MTFGAEKNFLKHGIKHILRKMWIKKKHFCEPEDTVIVTDWERKKCGNT